MPPIPSVGGNGSHILVHAQTEDRKRERYSLEMESRNLALAKGGSKKEGEKGVEGNLSQCQEVVEQKNVT